VARHARHARHARGELRDGRGRPDLRDRRPLRRPHHGKLSEFAPRAKFIHIDVDPAEISKNVPAHIPIVGDAKNILPRLQIEYAALHADSGRLEEWWQRIAGWQAKHPLRYDESADQEIKPQRLDRGDLRGDDQGDAIITTDVGQHQMWAAQFFHYKGPRRWISSAAWGPWASACPRRSARRSAGPTSSWSASRATARSR
jgi:acetolactate synthase-1/2/3 large subunit